MFRPKAGFTLIELVIVLAIIALLSALTLPKYSLIMANEKLELISTELLSDLREAQQIALSQGTIVMVDFHINYNKSTRDCYIVKVLEKNRFQNYKRVDFPQDIQLLNAPFGDYKQLSFSSSGQPNYNGTLRLENKNGQKMYVVVYHTGRCRITRKAP